MNRIHWLAICASLLGAGAGCAHGHGCPQPHDRPLHRMPHLTHVTGSGEAVAEPDIARTSVGVETRAVQVEDATAQANERMSKVIEALKKAGVAEKDLRTHSLSINFEQNRRPPEPEPRRTEAGSGPSKGTAKAERKPEVPSGFYRVRNMVEVTIRDLDRVSQVLSAATDAGADELWGITFELEDSSELTARAREKAVQEAQQNAEQLAQLTGVKLGPIVSITDGAVSGGPMPMMMGARAESASAKAMPVERGQLSVRHDVTLLYRIDAD